MGTFADSLFTVLMSWVRALVSGIWALFTSDHTTVLEFFGRNWMVIAAVIIGAGLVIDWIVWLLRWQPYHLWAQRARRLLRMEEPEEEEAAPARAHAATMPHKAPVYTRTHLDESREIEQYTMQVPVLAQQEEEDVLEQAQSAPDEYAYPGMRYGSEARQEMDSTQRYGAVTQEGPGAAEVERRRAEIEAWQLQMQEEARARAQAERAEREAQAAYEAKQAREAYEAEQARLAQQEYERQMAQYELEKAQYERELAEYERQKAEYEAQLAREAAMQEQAQELEPQEESQPTRRRRGAQKTYSDYVGGETVETLPDAPAWPQMQDDALAQTRVLRPVQEETIRHNKLLDRMAKMIEAEDEQLTARTKLPPRVNMQDAYKPAAEPRKPGRRIRNS